uniref:Homeobox domain-containing protein n=1 Tax=Globodera pallida TaxID=36090 RepID=A0A183CE93_GLOPA
MDTEMQMMAASASAAVGQQHSEGIQKQMPMDDGAALPQNGARITFENFLGQGRVNQLGGVFINGRPLPHEKRVQIVEMARRGIKPCKISRELKVSHGAVSKILNRFNETGSISPGQIGGNPRSRLSIQAVRQHILRLREEQPSLSAGQVQQMLVQRGICSRQNVPSSSRINRLLKAHKQQQQRAKPRPKSAGDSGATKSGGEKPLSHSIENILGGGGGDNGGGKQSPNGHANGTTGGAEIGRSPAVASPPSSSASSVSSNAAQIAPGSDEENQQQQQQHNQNDTFLADGRRARTSFSAKQLRILEQTFKNSPYPTPQQKECLIKVTELDEDKIITWFSNRRARNRRKAFQQQQHPPPQQILPFSSANSTATSPQSSIAVNMPMAMNQNSICPTALFPFPAAAFFPTLFAAPTGAFTPFGLLAANGGTSTAAMNLNCAVSAVQKQQKMCVDGTAEK